MAKAKKYKYAVVQKGGIVAVAHTKAEAVKAAGKGGKVVGVAKRKAKAKSKPRTRRKKR